MAGRPRYVQVLADAEARAAGARQAGAERTPGNLTSTDLGVTNLPSAEGWAQ